MNGFWDMVDPLSLPAYQSGPSEGQLMMGLRFRFSRTFQAEGRSQPSVSVLAGCAEFAGALSAAGTVFVTTGSAQGAALQSCTMQTNRSERRRPEEPGLMFRMLPGRHLRAHLGLLRHPPQLRGRGRDVHMDLQELIGTILRMMTETETSWQRAKR